MPAMTMTGRMTAASCSNIPPRLAGPDRARLICNAQIARFLMRRNKNFSGLEILMTVNQIPAGQIPAGQTLANQLGGHAIISLLEIYGVDTVFGIPGVHTLEFYRGIADRRMRHVGVRH